MIQIDDLIGVRYKKDGRNKKEGLDCYGLAIEVSKRFGHDLTDLINEVAENESVSFNSDSEILFSVHDGTKYTRDISKIPVIRVDEPSEEGDLVLFLNSRHIPYHIGVYLGEGLIIHCNKFGVHIEHINQMDYLIGRVYRWQK